ncbi:hypothetical protein [Streptomyces anulatus]|uniref:hypothetical protein n=1 Tax=Streptomyces anulatus TaxID=1892 RepID=UPI002E37C5D4|nr:hypothetical protein [Streptomyces anulatus]
MTARTLRRLRRLALRTLRRAPSSISAGPPPPGAAAPRPAENGSWPSCPAAQLPSSRTSEDR